MSSLTTIPTTPPASSPTATATRTTAASLSLYYTPASGYSYTPISVSTTASEGPSNVPGNSIAASRAAAAASSSSGSAQPSSGGSSLGLALGLGLGLGILLLLGLLGAAYVIRQRRIQRLAFAGRASRIQQTMRSVEERQQNPNIDTTESPLYF